MTAAERKKALREIDDKLAMVPPYGERTAAEQHEIDHLLERRFAVMTSKPKPRKKVAAATS